MAKQKIEDIEPATEETTDVETAAAEDVVVDTAGEEGTEQEQPAGKPQQSNGEDHDPPPQHDPDEVVVSIGDEKPSEEQPAPEWVRELRREQRELKRRNSELEAALQARTAPQQAAKEPELADFDYDEAKFKQAWATWSETRRTQTEREAAARAAQAKDAEAWAAKQAAYAASKAALKVKDYEDSEDAVKAALNPTQQGIIVAYADKPELVVYALGRNPAKLKELAAITDPLAFNKAITRLEDKVTVTKRAAPTPPETKVNGSAPKSGAVDSNLERLRAEAERTNDYTKVARYKAQLRAKQHNA